MRTYAYNLTVDVTDGFEVKLQICTWKRVSHHRVICYLNEKEIKV